jgi:transposase
VKTTGPLLAETTYGRSCSCFLLPHLTPNGIWSLPLRFDRRGKEDVYKAEGPCVWTDLSDRSIAKKGTLCMSDLLPVVGIDVSKATLDAHWGSQKGKRYQARFSNDGSGLESLQAWILQHHVTQVHCCLEATATYSDAVATFCFAHGHLTSVIAPHKLHAFRTSEGVLSKTDQIDARLLSCYGEQKHPAAWHPVSASAQQLKRDLDRLDEVKAMHRQEKNRLENQRLDAQARERIQAHLTWLEEEIARWNELLETRFAHAYEQEQDLASAPVPPQSMPEKRAKRSQKKPMNIAPVDTFMQIVGIGRLSALRMHAVFATMQEATSSEQMASYFGVVPHQHESGTSVKGKTRRRGGNQHARAWLYMCALSSQRFDPDMKQWAGELQARGLCKKAVIVAVMHKLVRILFGLFKTNAPYDATKAFPLHYPQATAKEVALAA